MSTDRNRVTNMTDKETAAHLRRWCLTSSTDEFSWPTDGCGYEQHIRFVDHRNKNWKDATENFTGFVLAYADSLERGK